VGRRWNVDFSQVGFNHKRDRCPSEDNLNIRHPSHLRRHFIGGPPMDCRLISSGIAFEKDHMSTCDKVIVVQREYNILQLDYSALQDEYIALAKYT
jgi:hypothetical protein